MLRWLLVMELTLAVKVSKPHINSVTHASILPEFWRIHSLIERSAYGIRRKRSESSYDGSSGSHAVRLVPTFSFW